ncbi:MAG: hypothetical protein ACJ8C4_15195 [Gemmataceae bacterium]
MRPRDQKEAARIDKVLANFHSDVRALPGIQLSARRTAFLEQVLESIHRVQYIERGVLRRRDVDRKLAHQRLDPNSDLFDPIKASAIYARDGEHDEACWQVFLFTHFGKNLRTGYALLRNVYGCLGKGPIWDWARVSANPDVFRRWLARNQESLRQGPESGYFGNHRKYVSLNAESRSGTGEAVNSYVRWVVRHGRHHSLFDHAAEQAEHDPRRAFEYLYRSMKAVASFGRVARFDYLTMIGKLKLAEIEPGSTYMTGATGPLSGARRLFGKRNTPPAQLDRWLVELEEQLKLPMGMQVLEDALCNWQKSPARFLPFRG